LGNKTLMTRLTLLLFIAITGITTGCSSSRRYLTPMEYDLAWNEDTVNDYRLILTKKGNFTYTIKEGTKAKTEIYKGTFGGTGNELFLNFNGNKPAVLNPVVIIEASNNYIIQYFTDGRKRMFLRLQWAPAF
jgi:hypothetical protein